jgi:Flp pilus assembly CpaF family ATPase
VRVIGEARQRPRCRSRARAGSPRLLNTWAPTSSQVLIERIVGPLGIRVDESSPWADARVPDGSRVQTRFLSVDRSGRYRDSCMRFRRIPDLSDLLTIIRQALR